MRIFTSLCLLATLATLGITPAFGQCPGICTFESNGGGGNFDLTAGQSLCVRSGVFIGNINGLAAGASICVDAGATFQPASINAATGEIVNYGTSNISSLNMLSGSSFENHDMATFSTSITGHGSLTNQASGTMVVETLNLDSGTIDNAGDLTFNTTSNLAMADLTNQVGGTLLFSQTATFNNAATLMNEGELTVVQGLNFNSPSSFDNIFQADVGGLMLNGDFDNTGIVNVTGDLAVNGAGSLENLCTITVAEDVVNNSGTFEVDGLLLVQDSVTNQGTLNNQANGVITGVDFTNTNTVIGSGNFYMTGITENFGPFGEDANGLNFYDTGEPADIFDNFDTAPDPSVTANSFLPPDEFFISPGCSGAIQFLPIELTLFEVRIDEQSAVLHWTTASEADNAGFEIQHRTDDMEGVAWQALAFVDGYGTTTETRTYTYRVDDLTPGRHQFRLQQVDFDGTTAFSQVVEVLKPLEGPVQIEAIYPNPVQARAEVRFRVGVEQSVRVELFNALGQRVRTVYDGRASAHRLNRVVVETKALPSGLYLLRVTGATFTATRRVILAK